MTKIDLGQTISIVANLGVIAGILFLGFELSQNNSLLELQAAGEGEDRRYSVADLVLSNPEYIDLLMKDESALTDADRERLILLGIRIFLTWEALWEAVQRGDANDEAARRTVRSVYWRSVHNYGADIAWETYKGRADPGFIEWVESHVLEAGPAR